MATDIEWDADRLREEWERLNGERAAVEGRLRELENTQSGGKRKQHDDMTTMPRSRGGVVVGRIQAEQHASSSSKRDARPPLFPSRMIERKDAPQRRPSLKEDGQMSGHRRMFGVLRSHLGSARSTLERDRALAKQQEAAQSVSEKLEKERKVAHQRRKDRFRTQRGLGHDERDRVLTELRKTEKKLLFATWLDHQRSLRGGLVTATEPRLAWRPSRDTDATKKLALSAEDASEAAVAAKRARLDDALSRLDAEFQERSQRRRMAREAQDDSSSPGLGGLYDDLYPPDDDAGGGAAPMADDDDRDVADVPPADNDDAGGAPTGDNPPDVLPPRQED